jgi:hypothetical protein
VRDCHRFVNQYLAHVHRVCSNNRKEWHISRPILIRCRPEYSSFVRVLQVYSNGCCCRFELVWCCVLAYFGTVRALRQPLSPIAASAAHARSPIFDSFCDLFSLRFRRATLVLSTARCAFKRFASDHRSTTTTLLAGRAPLFSVRAPPNVWRQPQQRAPATARLISSPSTLLYHQHAQHMLLSPLVLCHSCSRIHLASYAPSNSVVCRTHTHVASQPASLKYAVVVSRRTTVWPGCSTFWRHTTTTTTATISTTAAVWSATRRQLPTAAAAATAILSTLPRPTGPGSRRHESSTTTVSTTTTAAVSQCARWLAGRSAAT